MRRWLAVLLIGHLAGSYGAELYDALANYGQDVPAAARATAPIRILPWLVRHTVNSPGAGLVPFWIAYSLPLCGVVALAVACRRKRAPARGLDPLPPASGQ
jgi:hypothetical protein